ncbi:alpha/beta hydrolase family protein [Roseibium sediminicola]|uniref:Dienelactone hydrolase family protein n=1 Tax=Roseibium sediminicola TaxID=2933272 RepID=A0ABT0GU21_9HYPH|nr:dienelactone hydrolase family protein [Roseibium sp. CAU 1639]MCK7612934.1 dienelactone hydrolase family protein [Roseibium sp. CAU 1639]
MKRFVLSTVLTLVTGLSSPPPTALAGSPATVGVDHIQVHSKARGEDLSVLIWYPAAPGGTPVAVGENQVFEGSPAYSKAPRRAGEHPLILMSHGSGASVERMAWIASALAAEGYIVAGPNHPGTTSGDSTPEDTPKLWERTDDLAAVLDRLLEDPAWRPGIDAEKVGSLGFSLGGAAVLRSVGATATVEAYAQYCETYPAMADCQWFRGGRAYRDGAEIEVPPFDLRTVDREKFEQPERDPRVRAVVSVDPALAAVFDLSSLEAVEIPLHVVNLGLPATVPVAVKSDDLVAKAPKGSLDHVSGAVHFSFLPECRPGAAGFLKEIGETDALCADGGTRSRAALHRELADKIVAAFRHALKVGE